MLPNQRRWPRWLTVFTLLASLLVMSSGSLAAAPAVDIDGNTYTSPQYGYTLTWDGSWFVISEDSQEGFDILSITNGLTYVDLFGVADLAGNPALALATFIGILKQDETIESVTAVPDTRVLEDNRAAELYEVVATLSDGSTVNVMMYFDARTTANDDAVALFRSSTPSAQFSDEWPLIQSLLEGWSLSAGSEPGPNPNPDVTPEVPGSTAGEPGPVFVSGQWRVAVRSAALNDALPEVGLRARDGNEWLVIVADIANWSSEDGEFAAREFTVQTEGDDSPAKAARGSTNSVANALDVEPSEESMKVAIAAGETQRVVLVYTIPARSRGIVLQRKDDALPIADALANSIDPGSLPDPVAPPEELQSGELVSSSDGRTIRVQLEGEGDPSRIRLLGVAPPAKGDCYENESEKLLDGLVGSNVLVEEDAAVEGGAGQMRYVWLVNEDGSRTLLNHQVIADGLASLDSLPADARFGAWLQESESRAEDASVGLWGGCEPGAESTNAPEADSTPESTNTPEADTSPESTHSAPPPRTNPNPSTGGDEDSTPTPEE